MDSKVIRGILIASVASMGLAIVLVVAQIALYMGAPKPTAQPAAAARPPAPAPSAPAPPAEPEGGAEAPAAE
jgi:hypothetical protein